jgi:hypothetical protein
LIAPTAPPWGAIPGKRSGPRVSTTRQFSVTREQINAVLHFAAQNLGTPFPPPVHATPADALPFDHAHPEYHTLEPFWKGDGIRRARRTIGRGSGERLAWSDEDARAHVTSKVLG